MMMENRTKALKLELDLEWTNVQMGMGLHEPPNFFMQNF